MATKLTVCLIMKNFKLVLERLALFFVWFDFFQLAQDWA